MGLCELAKKKKNIILYMCAREKRNYIFRYTEKKRKYLNFERIKNTMIKVEQRGNIAENMTYQPSTCNYFGKG